MSNRDSYLSVSQLIEQLPPGRGSARVSKSCIVRWILLGLKRPNGERVRLTASRLGSRWLIRQSDVDAFLAALQPDFGADSAAQIGQKLPRGPGRRERAHRAADDRLAMAGV